MLKHASAKRRAALRLGCTQRSSLVASLNKLLGFEDIEHGLTATIAQCNLLPLRPLFVAMAPRHFLFFRVRIAEGENRDGCHAARK